LFKLKYEKIIDFSERSLHINNITLLCLVVGALGQIVTFFVSVPSPWNDSSALIGLLVAPIVSYAVILGLMIFFTRYYAKKEKPAMQAYVNIMGICLVCFTIIWVYNANASVSAILCLPLITSLLYVDKKPLFLAFLCTLIFSVVYNLFFIKSWQYGPDYNSLVQLFTITLFLACCYVASRIIINSVSVLVCNFISKNEEVRRDSFTGLLNHTSFFEHLDQMIIENHREKTVFSLIIWDIDDFKSINDTFGHDMGDKVLTLFSKALKECAGSDDFSFRYGGEEFIILTPCELSNAFQLSNRVRERFTQYTVTLPLGRVVTSSSGVCEYNRSFGGSREFFSAADRALYIAKRAKGKNTSHCWHDSDVDVIHIPTPIPYFSAK